MPSRKKNSGIIILPKNGQKQGTTILIRKTGYANVWLYDQHIYWDYTIPAPNLGYVDFNGMINDYNLSQQAKKRIVITRR